MKKLFSSVLAISMAATCVVGLAACGGNDEETAKDAINAIKALYLDKSNITDTDYKVVGQTKVGDDTYKVDWSVSSATFNNLDDYVKVNPMDEATKTVTISVTKATEVIEYKLNASVTVGKVTESVSFDRKVSAAIDRGEVETTTVTLAFTKDNRKSQDKSSQVFEDKGIKVTNLKGSSTTDVADYADPARFYKSSTIKIEYPGIKHIDFDCTYIEYATALVSSLNAAHVPGKITVVENSKSNNVVSLELEAPVDYLEFSASGQIRIKTMTIEAVVGGASDKDKATVSAAMARLNRTLFASITDVTLPTDSYVAKLSWGIKETTDLVTVADGKLKIVKLPEAKTTLTLVVTAKVNSEEASTEITLTILPAPVLENDGTAEKPFTVEEALWLAATLDANEYYKKDNELVKIYVKGYVIATDGFQSKYSNWEGMYIAGSKDSTKDSEDAMQVYRFALDGTFIKAETDLVKGAEIVVCGYLQNYYGTNRQVTYNETDNPVAVSYTKPAA